MSGSCNIEKSYLVDVKTKLYIATDSNPVDVHTYELCSDLVDVVIDVSYIYGVKHSAGAASPHTPRQQQLEWATPYDEESASAIRLNSGMVLYLREVSDLLALVCVMREEYFFKRSLLDYNIDCLKVSLGKVMRANNAGKGEFAFASAASSPTKSAAGGAGSHKT